MKKVFKFLFVFFLLSFLIKPIFADDTGFKVDNVVGTSVNLSWDKDLKSSFKQIYYGTSKFDKSSEAEQFSELIEGNSYIYTIDSLENNIIYYFKLEGTDSNGNVLFSSDVLEAKIGDVTSNDSMGFKLEKVEQTGVKQIKLTFSEDLDSNQKILNENFKIENISDSSKFLSVSEFDTSNSIKGNTLFLDLNEDIPLGTEFKVLVFGILNANGDNIKKGIEAEQAFVGKDFSEKDDKELDNLNSAGVSKNNKKVGGKDLKKSDVKKDIIGTANKKADNNKETETETGPSFFIFLFLTFILSTVFFISKRIKNS